MKFKILVLVFSCCFIDLLGQEILLPHFPTADEERTMVEYLRQKNSSSFRSDPAPPPGTVRTMAEWEQIQAVIITWAGHNTILREIVRNAVRECKVLIITTNPTNVTDQLTTAGIPLDSVQFVNTTFNSIWVRDYGPWTVYKNDVDSLFLIDWIYNRPRMQDDSTPLAIAAHLNIPIFEATVDPDDWVHTGGNHLPDGLGTAFSSMLVLEENQDKTEAEIDTIAKKFLGVKQYIKFPTLPYDGIHHLDMHMRILDEETIMFGEYPPGVADGPQINANIDYLLDEFTTAFGNKYHVIRIPMPPDAGDNYPDQGGNYRTYTNSIFINKTILVPTYEEKYDTTALRIYKENLPGYNVVGINCNAIIPSLGALHCITKLVGVREPLLIAHARLRDSDDAQIENPVDAIIKHHSGINEANLFFREAGDSIYTLTPMFLTDTLQNVWSAIIPSHAAGTEVQYYLQAQAHNGKEQVRPIVAPQGYFNFRIHGEPVNQPPLVSITYPLDSSVFDIEEESLNIEIDANDTDGDIINLVVFVNGDSIAIIDSMPYTSNWLFPGEGQFEISVRARDDKGAETISDIIKLTVKNTTATNVMINENIQVFPNPVHDVLWIGSNSGTLSNVAITNLFGQALSLQQLHEGNLSGYDFSLVPPGIYLFKCIVEETWRVVPVIKL